MSLITCPECSKKISDRADCCPHCGLPSRQFLSNRGNQGETLLTSTDNGYAEEMRKPLKEFFERRGRLLETDDYITSKQKREMKTDYARLFLYLSDILNSKGRKAVPDLLKDENTGGFLRAYDSLDKDVDEHNERYVEKELQNNSEYFDTMLSELDPGIRLDEEQRTAIVTDDSCCLLVAGAGSGKTTTMAAKIKYLVDKKSVDPQDIVVFSFTNKATNELRERVNNRLGIPADISTFHSFGLEVVGMAAESRPNLLYNPYQVISRILGELIYYDNELLKKVVLFLGYYFDLPDGVFEFGSLEQYHAARRRNDYESLKSELGEYISNIQESLSKKKKSLNGEFLRSAEEVQIANFLFLNGIDYEYEKPYPYPLPGSFKRYTPDFIIRQGGKETYLEHFGINEEGQNIRFTEGDLKKYRKSIKDKRTHHRRHGTRLIETYSACGGGRSVIIQLEELLVANDFVLKPKSPEEIYEKIAKLEKEKYIQNFTEFTAKFIELYKVSGYGPEQFAAFNEKAPNPRIEIFLDIAEKVYGKYQDILYAKNEIDFADMINGAKRRLEDLRSAGMTLPYKYIIIDEFQDIARQRFDLLRSLLNVTDAKIIAVGDDWQSVYSFAGSDVTLFTKFVELIGGGTEMQITRTYRNSQELIDMAGRFVQLNPAQIRKRLISNKSLPDPLQIRMFDDSSWVMTPLAQEITKIIGEIIEEYGEDSSILVLGRYNFDKYKLTRTGLFSDDSGNLLCKEHPSAKVEYLTVHRSKGLGYDNVIIMNMYEGKYGFPCQVEKDPIMRLVTREDDSVEFAEERRLMYVAMTRTKNKVFILAPANNPSRFLIELAKQHDLPNGDKLPKEMASGKRKKCPRCGYPLKYEDNKTYGLGLYMCTNEPEVCGFMTNSRRYHFDLKKCPRCNDGYLIVITKDNNAFYGCTTYGTEKSCTFTLPILEGGRCVLDESRIKPF